MTFPQITKCNVMRWHSYIQQKFNYEIKSHTLAFSRSEWNASLYNNNNEREINKKNKTRKKTNASHLFLSLRWYKFKSSWASKHSISWSLNTCALCIIVSLFNRSININSIDWNKIVKFSILRSFSYLNKLKSVNFSEQNKPLKSP